MSGKPKGVSFTRGLAVRIGAAVRQVEGTYRDGTYGRLGSGTAPSYPMPATVTTAIPTGTLTSPSNTGRITVYRDDDAGGLVAAETGQECNNYHTLSASVPIGTTITVYWRAGVWWLLQPDCY